MHPYVAYPLAVLIGYLLGSSNMAIYLSRARGVDLRAGGSGNPGASNTVSLMGWKAGALVATATSVSPITSGEMRHLRAMPQPPLTSHSAP